MSDNGLTPKLAQALLDARIKFELMNQAEAEYERTDAIRSALENSWDKRTRAYKQNEIARTAFLKASAEYRQTRERIVGLIFQQYQLVSNEKLEELSKG